MSNNLFSDVEVREMIRNISVLSKIDNWVVNIIATILLWVLILVTSGGGADWIRISANISIKLNLSIVVAGVVSGTWNTPNTVITLLCNPLVSKQRLLISNMSLGINHIPIKSEIWNEIICWMTLRGVEGGSHHVTERCLGLFGMLLSVSDVTILSTEVRDEVVNWVTLWSIERSIKFMIETMLSIGNIVLSG